MISSKILSCLWTDEIISELDSDEKLAWFWLLTNREVNILGMTKVSEKRFCFETGSPWEALQRLRLAHPKGLVWAGSTVWVVRFLEHQFGRGVTLTRNNLLKTVLKQLEAVRDEELFGQVIANYPELKDPYLDWLKTRGLQPLPKPLATPPQALQNPENPSTPPQALGNPSPKKGKGKIEGEGEGEGEIRSSGGCGGDEPSRDHLLQTCAALGVPPHVGEYEWNDLESRNFQTKPGIPLRASGILPWVKNLRSRFEAAGRPKVWPPGMERFALAAAARRGPADGDSLRAERQRLREKKIAGEVADGDLASVNARIAEITAQLDQ